MKAAIASLVLAQFAFLQQDDSAPKLLWKFSMKSASYGSGTVADMDGDGKPEILFGTYFNDEHLYCMNAKDGSLKWKFKSDGGPFDASNAVVGKEIILGDSSTGKLFCIDEKGKEKWTLMLPNSTDSPPAVADLDGDGKPEIIAGSMWKQNGMGDVSVYRSDNQKLVWKKEVKGCVQSEPCIIDLNRDRVPDVIVTSWRGDNCVHAISGKDGTEIWKFEYVSDKDGMGLYHGVAAGALTKGGDIRIVFGTCSTATGSVYVLDSAGKLVWKKLLKEYLFAPATIADVDGDGSAEIFVIGQSTYSFSSEGKEIWRADVSSARGPAITDVDGNGTLDLLLGTNSRELVALDGKTGMRMWSFDAACGKNEYETVDFAPLVADFDGDGFMEVFFVCGKGTSDETKSKNYGTAYALKLPKCKGPAWTTFRGNLRRTGTNP